MRSADNPYSPGAGTPPPELAGREGILAEAGVAIDRTLNGKLAKNLMMLGLRGVGKTVLLNRMDMMSEERGCVSTLMEAERDRSLADLLVPHLLRVLRQLDAGERAKDQVRKATAAVREFASGFSVKYGEVEVSIRADAATGDLALDLADVLVSIGEAARARGTAVSVLIDEVQYLSSEELAAIMIALHKASQRQLPIVLFAAGLPQLAALAGEAKSYAERLFFFREIGSLTDEAARTALIEPARREGVTIEDGAVEVILSETEGYPFFLQLWGYFAWEQAADSPITDKDAEQATVAAVEELDQGFFKVRLERLTERQREYVYALARLEVEPAGSTAVAQQLGRTPKEVAPVRSEVIAKGVAYSPTRGKIAFTVPKFGDYLRRLEAAVKD